MSGKKAICANLIVIFFVLVYFRNKQACFANKVCFSNNKDILFAQDKYRHSFCLYYGQQQKMFQLLICILYR